MAMSSRDLSVLTVNWPLVRVKELVMVHPGADPRWLNSTCSRRTRKGTMFSASIGLYFSRFVSIVWISEGATYRMAVDGIIFDFDGVIIDTETPDFELWQDFYRSRGLDLAVDLWLSRVGVETGG